MANGDGAGGELPSIGDVRKAADRIKGRIVRTPLLKSERLSALIGAELCIKYETMQRAASFKERGALNKLLELVDRGGASGVVAASAGNHAQGVALHATNLGISATIFMPDGTPAVKRAATESFGGKVEIKGETFDDAKAAALAYAAEHNLTFVHPFDDPFVIAGQGTVALEMLEDEPELDMIVIPVGGGGLIAGCAIAAKAVKPGVEIIGVEAATYPCLYNILHKTALGAGGQTIAEGIAVKELGRLNRAILENILPARCCFLVTEAEIEHAIAIYAEHGKIVAEGAAAAGLALLVPDKGATHWIAQADDADFGKAAKLEAERNRQAVSNFRRHIAGKKIGLILCGGNIDPRLHANVLIRDLIRTHRTATIRVPLLLDLPGQLSRISGLVAEAGGNILEVKHDRMDLDLPAKGTDIDIRFSATGPGACRDVFQTLKSGGWSPRWLSKPLPEDLA